MIVKYALLVFDLSYPFDREFFRNTQQLDDNLQLKFGKIESLIDPKKSSHWQSWLGSIAWDDLHKEDRLFFLTWMTSSAPDIIDLENEKLSQYLTHIHFLLPKLVPLKPSAKANFLFTGNATLNGNAELTGLEIQTMLEPNIWRPSYYMSSEFKQYYEWYKMNVDNCSLVNGLKKLIKDTKHIYENPVEYRQHIEMLRSFNEALLSMQLEFKIPNLVRTIESLIACRGAKDFAKRFIEINGLVRVSHPFELENLGELLADLYDLRSDSAHGKPFAYRLEKKMGSSDLNFLIAKFEYLAEWAARNMIWNGLNHSRLLNLSKDFDTLEEAWKKGHIRYEEIAAAID